MDLTDKVAFVTGGSGDIGAAICAALAAAGCDIALSYVGNTERADRAAAVTARGRHAQVIGLDQRDEESVDAAAAGVIEHFGRCDILVNNEPSISRDACVTLAPRLARQLGNHPSSVEPRKCQPARPRIH
jgi:NAD(P)-dependent dehydrogenase (short-subunit alcohol dehydrogenase family)